MSEFVKVIPYRNWCEYDQINGITLKPGKISVEVLWPDNTITEEVITVVEGSFEVMDMGHMTQCPSKHAFITVKHKGVGINFRVAETDLKVRLK